MVRNGLPLLARLDRLNKGKVNLEMHTIYVYSTGIDERILVGAIIFVSLTGILKQHSGYINEYRAPPAGLQHYKGHVSLIRLSLKKEEWVVKG